MQLNISLKSSY